MHYDFELAGRRVRLWQRLGEGYGHVLMKALGFAMFVGEFPGLEIERRVGLRYKPDLVAASDGGAWRFAFWGECGLVTVRKVAWLLKHGGVERLVLFKLGVNVSPLVAELRETVGERYRPPGRLRVVNFAPDIAELAADRRVARVPRSWYTTTDV
ncbi:MAG TPA: hypothetical protein VER08_11040 [Pyrinomonadaceae bacterium]|nr:hypothetical protein [Pyrinomonadaceae bacterium]